MKVYCPCVLDDLNNIQILDFCFSLKGAENIKNIKSIFYKEEIKIIEHEFNPNNGDKKGGIELFTYDPNHE